MAAKPRRRRVSPALAELLNRIERDVGSLNRIADAAGISQGSVSRAARGDGGMSEQSAKLLAAAFGARYGFTYEDIVRYSVFPDSAEVPPSVQGDPVPQPVRVGFQRARGILTEEKVRWMGELLAGQIAMLIERLDRGELDTPELLDSDPARR